MYIYRGKVRYPIGKQLAYIHTHILPFGMNLFNIPLVVINIKISVTKVISTVPGCKAHGQPMAGRSMVLKVNYKKGSKLRTVHKV